MKPPLKTKTKSYSLYDCKANKKVVGWGENLHIAFLETHLLLSTVDGKAEFKYCKRSQNKWMRYRQQYESGLHRNAVRFKRANKKRKILLATHKSSIL